MNPQMAVRPVMIWAGIGTAFLGLAAFVWGSWIFSDVFRPVPVGPDPLPRNVQVWLWILQAATTTVGCALLWKFVFGPLVRTRSIGFDGLLLINFLLMWWTDPIDNYVNFTFMYNGHLLNMGSWAIFIPGWGYPNHENFPEPLLIMFGFYLGVFMLCTLVGCWTLRRLRDAFPSLSIGWCVFVVFLTQALLDLLVENLFLRTGVAAYPGVVRSLSIFPGEVYQWPLYEAGIIGFINTGFICLRTFKDDKGLSFVERGISRLQLSQGRKTLLTFLALAGFIQPFFLFGYFVPYNLFAIRADDFPAYPSYMRSMICGEGTRVACPSYEWVPIPRAGAKWFVGPDDPRLPAHIRDGQGISASGRDPYGSD